MLSELLQITVLTGLLVATIRIATPLLLAAMGELMTERSGVMNLGVEGTMLMAAFASFLVAYYAESLLLATLAAILTGAVMGLILAFMAVNLRVDQTVTGLAMNLLASGLTLFVYRTLFKEESLVTIARFSLLRIPLLSQIPILGEVLFSQRLITYLALLSVPLMSFFLFRTRLGLALRSTGENPEAVDTRGLSVARMRYLAVILGASMAGLGGAFLTIGLSDRFVPDITGGRGWLAIIIVIAGNWQPLRMLIATLLFAFLDAFQLQLQGTGVDIPFQLLLALPYVFALIALISVRMRSCMPGALGVLYVKE